MAVTESRMSPMLPKHPSSLWELLVQSCKDLWMDVNGDTQFWQLPVWLCEILVSDAKKESGLAEVKGVFIW